MEIISNKFRGEIEEIERIQEVVRMRQRRLARANLRACCAIMIQTCWRRHRARVLARERRGAILGAMVNRWWTRLKCAKRFSRKAYLPLGLMHRMRASVQIFIESRYKRNRTLQKIQRFVSASIKRTKRQRAIKEKAVLGLQRSWKRRVARETAARDAMVEAAIEV
ncbi:unnamed protein product [Sphacelaria rigidula]